MLYGHWTTSVVPDDDALPQASHAYAFGHATRSRVLNLWKRANRFESQRVERLLERSKGSFTRVAASPYAWFETPTYFDCRKYLRQERRY